MCIKGGVVFFVYKQDPSLDLSAWTRQRLREKGLMRSILPPREIINEP
jgi:hypothetical protein